MNNSLRLCHGRSVGRGFTLIEVLVVVSIIALLISILLPSLKEAREQAKKTVCLANLSALGKAAGAYLNTERDQFAWGSGRSKTSGTGPIDENFNEPYLRTWGYGGKRGKLGTTFYSAPSDWFPHERPLNRYVYNTTKLGQAVELKVYECPSDADIGIRLNGEPDSEFSGISGYESLGTSYQANHNWRYYSEHPDGENAGSKRRWDLLRNICKIMQKQGPSRFVLLYEDSADWALTTADLLPAGFRVSTAHKRHNYHSMLFMDTHAANIMVDYTKNINSLKRSGTGAWVVRQNYMEN